MGRSVTYGRDEMNRIEAGISEIQEAFDNFSDDELASLLFALERYLDPYYGYKLKYKDEIFISLEKLFIARQNIDIREDIRDLLFYGNCDYDFIADNLTSFDSDSLEVAIEILSNTYDKKYLPCIREVLNKVSEERMRDAQYYYRELELNGKLS